MCMDKLFTLIDFSKIKFKLLNEMLELENNNQADNESYIQLLNHYKLVCEMYNKKLNSISISERYELYEKMILVNPNLFKKVSFEYLLELDEQHVILNRIRIDLINCPIMKLYDNKDNNNILFKLFNIQEEKETYDPDAINSYMCQDFVNVLYNVIDSRIKKEESENVKQELTKYKSKLLVLSSDLEDRALMTNFLVPNTFKLVNRIAIETTGMSLDEYFKNFDSFIIGYMEHIFLNNMARNKKRNVYLDSILIETLAILLNDKEYIDVFKLEIETSVDEICFSKEKLEVIKALIEILVLCQNNNVNSKKNRQYTKI